MQTLSSYDTVRPSGTVKKRKRGALSSCRTQWFKAGYRLIFSNNQQASMSIVQHLIIKIQGGLAPALFLEGDQEFFLAKTGTATATIAFT
jgi:hypothetical protein